MITNVQKNKKNGVTIMKRVISILLCLILAFSLCMPAFAAAETKEYKEYPTIYVTGAQTNNLYSADNKLISDFDIDLGAVLEEYGMDLVSKFLFGMLSDDYKMWANRFHEIFVGIYGDAALDKNGEASNGSHPEYHSSTVDVTKKSSGFGIWDYRFWYDWRISPLVTGEELEAYIDRVILATGAEKVNLVGRCYGANVIAAYVAMNKEHAIANVDDIAYYAPSIDGIDFMTALYTGELYLDGEALDSFLAWFLENKDLIEDDALSSLILTLVQLFEQAKVLGFTAEKIDLLIDRIKSDLIPPILRDSFASWPSYWAMVTEGNLEKAIDFIFDGCKDEYAGLITKVRDYYDIVQSEHNKTVTEMMDNNLVRYNIFAKYNFPEFPIYEGATVQSDGDTPLFRQTFGATAANYGEVLSDKYLASVSAENQKYISPDHKVDASTGLLPENTWYVKNLHHNYWGSIHEISLDIMNHDYYVSDGAYPQFMDNNNDMKEVTPDEDYNKPANNTLMSLFRFLTSFFNFFAKLLRGELSLGK